MTAHYLDFDCADCGAKAGKPCKHSLYPHAARRKLRDAARAEEFDDDGEEDHRDVALREQGFSL